ncbi:MAG: hypothetical protein WBZ36_14755 [Candidatus Nitrosopolaris sp.]
MEVEGPDADIGVFLIIYVAIIVKFYGYVVVYYEATAKECPEIMDSGKKENHHVLNKFIGLKLAFKASSINYNKVLVA